VSSKQCLHYDVESQGASCPHWMCLVDPIDILSLHSSILWQLHDSVHVKCKEVRLCFALKFVA